MNFKKVVALGLASLMVFSMTACANNGSTEPSVAEIVVKGDLPMGTQAETGEEQESEATSDGKETALNFWYTDPNMTAYFEFALDRFHQEHPEIVVNLNMVASTGYLENINTQSIRQNNAVDVYMLHNADLEQAYLAGLAKAYEQEGTVFTPGNFGKSAIRAVSYKNKQVAYPLFFDSAFLVYNKNYVVEVPKTFDELLNFTNGREEEDENQKSILDKIEKTLIWPVSDYTFNYAFLSNDFVMGGANGDDRSQIDTANENVINTLIYYRNLYDFFAINRKEVDYNYCVQKFIEGKIAFTFVKMGMLPTLDEAVAVANGATTTAEDTISLELGGAESEEKKEENQEEEMPFAYGTAKMPDITETIAASSLSYTQALVVNPYSMHQKEAQEMVQALCYDYVDEFYEMTGFLPSRRNWNYDNDIFKGIYDNYDASTPRPKMMTLGDYYIQLEILLHKVWDDDGDVTELVNEFQDYVENQVK